MPQPTLSITAASVGSTPDALSATYSVPPAAPGLTLVPVLRSGAGSAAPGFAAPLPGNCTRKCPCAAIVPDSAKTCDPLGVTVLVAARYCRVVPASGNPLAAGL